MKKTFTKLAGGIMAASMILGTAGVAAPQVFADDGLKITVHENAADTQKDNHKHTAFQIFGGTVTQNDQGANFLSDIIWGTGIDATKLDNKAAIKAINTALGLAEDSDDLLTSGKLDAEKVADKLGEFSAVQMNVGDPATAPATTTGTNKDKVEAFARAVYNNLLASAGTEITETATFDKGYYIITDEYANADDVENGSYSLSKLILNFVTEDTDIYVKNSVPEVEKKTKDKNDSVSSGYETINGKEWVDSADYDIGDKIPYQLTATLGDGYANFDTYKLSFKDTMCKGLTLDQSSIKVYVANDTDESKWVDVTSQFTSNVSTVTAAGEYKDGTLLTVSVNAGNPAANDLKKVTGATITDGTKIVVRYDAVLNKNAVIGAAGNPNKVSLEYSNNPDQQGDGDTGETIEDKNIIFTFEQDVNKIKKDNSTLNGAGFTLFKEYTSGDAIKVADYNADGTVKTTTENGVTKIVYKEVTPISGTAAKALFSETDSTKIAKTSNAILDCLEANKYYLLVDSITLDNASKFEFKGIDDGNYVLVENKVPDTYNAWAGTAFTVSSTHTQDPAALELTGLTSNFDGTATTGDLPSGILENNVVNKQGTELPSTGGIGTTIFYIVGAAAAVTAIVLLTTRRRAHKED